LTNTDGKAASTEGSMLGAFKTGENVLSNANECTQVSSSSSSSSDASVVETPMPANDVTNNGIDSTIVATLSSTLHAAVKQLPAKKKSKPIKPSSLQHRGLTPPLISPNKRSSSSAHTRSNAGTAELLTGVEIGNPHPSVMHHGSKPATSKLSNIGSMHMKSSIKAGGGTVAGVHHNKKISPPGGGVMTTRNGLPVTKIMMNTGTLYIYMKTHHAEFIRTK
jgi:hypothetical protein